MQDKYTRSARGQDCQVRIPGVCNFDESTTIFAHLNGAGIGRKHFNIHGSYCCSSCHDAIDKRLKTEYSHDDLRMMHFDGMVRTQQIMISDGVLKL